MTLAQQHTATVVDNTQVYSLNSTLIAVMDEVVGKPYHEQAIHSAWQREVLNKDGDYQRKVILQQGRADFDNPSQGLTPEQTVLLYCSQYLQMHLASSRYLFDTCHLIYNGCPPFLNPNSFFIDFGCGPLTSALALAWYSAQVGNPKPKVNYIGIERSQAMIAKAKDFSRSPALFSPYSQFHFIDDYTDVKTLTRQIRQHTSLARDPWVVLNFSYFFASLWLDTDELAAVVNRLFEQFPSHRFCILFQNPTYPKLNQNWYIFKDALTLPFQCIAGNHSLVKYNEYPVHVASQRRWHCSKPPIKLHYQVLVTSGE